MILRFSRVDDMTTLDIIEIKGFPKKWLVTKEISGDLSFSYALRPASFKNPGYLMGVGIPANKLSDIRKIIKIANKHGYKDAYDIWYKQSVSKEDYHFGYLPEKEAKKYAPYAYGEYAKSIRKKYNLRMVKNNG